MSEPEIARRCAACGVSLRQHALYCPQCGQQIIEKPVAQTTEISDPHPSGIAAVADNVRDRVEGVADNVRDRVEKIRHVSSVVIDQAAYDPSLRFLLIVAVLFLLFLVLLILSKVIG